MKALVDENAAYPGGMCGQFALDAKTDDLVRGLFVQEPASEDWWQQWRGSYSIAPTDSAPIVRDRGDGRTLELVRWEWPKPASRPRGAPIINARMEKLVSGFWTPAFTAARCVVPMRGYYEWTGEKNFKIPHFLHGDDKILAAAGLTWSMDVKGERTRCFVVITRQAHDALGEVHDRMPAFLTPDAMDAWLDPIKLDQHGRLELLGTLDDSSSTMASTIRHHIVDRRVNSVRTVDPSDPTLIEPAA